MKTKTTTKKTKPNTKPVAGVAVATEIRDGDTLAGQAAEVFGARKKSKDTAINVRITWEMRGQIDRSATQCGHSSAALVRALIERYWPVFDAEIQFERAELLKKIALLKANAEKAYQAGTPHLL